MYFLRLSVKAPSLGKDRKIRNSALIWRSILGLAWWHVARDPISGELVGPSLAFILPDTFRLVRDGILSFFRLHSGRQGTHYNHICTKSAKSVFLRINRPHIFILLSVLFSFLTPNALLAVMPDRCWNASFLLQVFYTTYRAVSFFTVFAYLY